MKGVSVAKRIFLLIILGFAFAARAGAADMTKHFTIVSPKSVQRISYGLTRPPFRISAPEGWFMAKRLDSDRDPQRAVFMPVDPKPELATGIIDSEHHPYITVFVFLNASHESDQDIYDSMLKKKNEKGSKILSLDKVTAGGQSVTHYATLNGKQNDVSCDTYIFMSGEFNILIFTACPKAGREPFEKVIKEVLGSVSLEPFPH